MSSSTENQDESDIQKFFANKKIFVTGGTGFLGNILLDKLLRSCSRLNQIYILTRQKKGKDVNERFKTLFEDVVFERMRKECPEYLSKVTPVVGDCEKPDLGLSDADKKLLIEEVDVVFHVAATVRFDEAMPVAVNINIRAVRDLLEIAHSMKKLKAFIHVSTAYSNCVEKTIIEEKFYDPPLTPDGVIQITQAMPDEVLIRITPELVKPWPNTYAFTKAIAEDVVREKGHGLPVAVVRPAIVIATAKEPIPGWINNFYGPTGVVAGAGVGLLRSIHANGDCISDLVPCDSVVNSIIAAAWNTGVTWESRKGETALNNSNSENNIPVYNYVSSNWNPLTWREFMKYNEKAEPEIPTVLAVWVYGLTVNKFRFVHNIYCIFLHLIPALIVDTFARIIGKEPKLWKAYEKIHKFSDVISYFSTQQWKFIDSNTQQLNNKLSQKDRELFDFDLSRLDWKEYFYHHIRGVRAYIIGDSLDTVPCALEKRRKLMIAHYTLVTLFWIFMLYIAFSLI